MQTSGGATPLMYACQQCRESEVLEILRKQPQAVKDRDRTYKTPLHYCAENPNSSCAEAILKVAPELVNAQDENGYCTLHLAVIAGNKPLIKLLISKGADVNIHDNEGHSAVHWAIVSSEKEALEMIIRAGANPSTADIHGGYPLHYAVQMCGCNCDHLRSFEDTVRVVETLLNFGVDVGVKDKDGRQPILWAASAGSADAVVHLVSAGACVEAADKDGLTALHCAASRGHTSTLETLISLCGANVDVIDGNGCSALFYSVTLGHADATELLLQLGAEPNRQDRKGRTPAHCGAAKGQLETLRILQKHGGNLWMRNVKGDIPLHEAVASGRKDLVLWLLSQCPEAINLANNDGRCPLHIASMYNNTEMVKVLLDSKSLVNPVMRTSKGVLMTPLNVALSKGHRSCGKYLQLHGGVPFSKVSRVEPASSFALRVSPPDDTEKPTDNTQIKISKSRSSTDNRDLTDRENREIVKTETGDKKKVYRRRKRKKNPSNTQTQDSDTDDSDLKVKTSAHPRSNDEEKQKSSRETDKVEESVKKTAKVGSESKPLLRNKSFNETKNVSDLSPEDFPPLMQTISHLDIVIMEPDVEGSKQESEINAGQNVRVETVTVESEKVETDVVQIKDKRETTTKDKETVQEIKEKTEQTRTKDKTAVEEVIQMKETEKIEDERQTKSKVQDSKEQTEEKRQINAKETQQAKIAEENVQAEEKEETEKKIQTNELTATEGNIQVEDDRDKTETTANEEKVTELKETKDKTKTTKEETINEEKVTQLQQTKEKTEEQRQTTENITQPEENEQRTNPTEQTTTQIEDIKEKRQLKTKQEETDEKRKETPEKPAKPVKKPNGNSTGGRSSDETSRKTTRSPKSLSDGDNTKRTKKKTDTKKSVSVKETKTTEDNITVTKPTEESSTADNEKPIEDDKPKTETSSKTDKLQQEEAEQPSGEAAVGNETATKSADSPEKTSEENLQERTQTEDEIKPTEIPVVETKYSETNEQFTMEAPTAENARNDEKLPTPGQISETTEQQKSETKPDGDIQEEIIYKEERSNENLAQPIEERHQEIKKPDSGKDKGEKSEKAVAEQNDSVQVEDFRSAKNTDEKTEPTEKPIPDEEKTEPQDESSEKKTTERQFRTPKVSRLCRRHKDFKDDVNQVSVTQLVQNTVRKYHMERGIFYQLLELKRYQIRSGRANEQVLVKRLADEYERSRIFLGMKPFTGVYKFKEFEKFLYDQLKALNSRRSYIIPEVKSYDDIDALSGFLKKSRYKILSETPPPEMVCTCITQRCHHSACAYTNVPCSAYITDLRRMRHRRPRRESFFPRIEQTPTGKPEKYKERPATLELIQGSEKHVITLPQNSPGMGKRYYVTFTIKGAPALDEDYVDDSFKHRHAKSV